MMDKLEIDLNQNMYYWISRIHNECVRSNNNLGVAVNRITGLWILTLIVWWFK